MRDIWQAFKAAVVRFWDNRFNPKEISPELRALQIELEYKRRDYEKLFEAYQQLVNPAKRLEDTEDTKELKPIRSYTPSWSYRAEQLEKKKREERLAGLEKELGVEINASNNG